MKLDRYNDFLKHDDPMSPHRKDISAEIAHRRAVAEKMARSKSVSQTYKRELILKLIEKRDRVDRVRDIRNKVNSIIAKEKHRAQANRLEELGISPSPIKKKRM